MYDRLLCLRLSCSQNFRSSVLAAKYKKSKIEICSNDFEKMHFANLRRKPFNVVGTLHVGHTLFSLIALVIHAEQNK